MKLKFTTTGKSMKELLEIYGTGKGGFFSEWWKDESWAKEHPLARIYETYKANLTNLTFDEQKAKLKKGFDFPHPAVLAEIVLTHYKETGKKLLNNWYSRTNSLDTNSKQLIFSTLNETGLNCDSNWLWIGLRRRDLIGVFPLKLKTLKKLKSQPSDKSLSSEMLSILQAEIDRIPTEVHASEFKDENLISRKAVNKILENIKSKL